MNLHEKITFLRLSNKWSQEDLAEWVGVSRQSVTRWESGRAMPETRHVIRMSKLFGVTTDQLLLDDVPIPGEPTEKTSAPPSEPPAEIRRITAEDSYAFTVFCQREARSFALACASLPIAPALMFFGLGLAELLPGDDGDMLLVAGSFLGFITLLLGLCELLCAWLGNYDLKLNGGKPYVLDPRALEWASDAYSRYQQIQSRQNTVAMVLALFILPVFLLLLWPSLEGGSDFWIGAALAVPLVLIAIITYLCARTSRISRCYRHLIERAEQENDDATAG